MVTSKGMSSQPRRTVLPRAKKDEIIRMILTKTATIDEVCKEYSLQPYQVFAWVGERSIKNHISSPSTSEAIPPPLPRGEQSIVSMHLRPGDSPDIDPELARAVGEWWLRSKLRA